MSNNKKEDRIVNLSSEECAIILTKNRTIEIILPDNYTDEEEVPDYILTFFGAAFALQEPEWIKKLYELAKEKTAVHHEKNVEEKEYKINTTNKNTDYKLN